jgi:hypothetical protein
LKISRHFIDNAPGSQRTNASGSFLCDLLVVDKEKGRTSNKARKYQSGFCVKQGACQFKVICETDCGLAKNPHGAASS